ncbi:MAG: hypothetical protein M0002_08090 [Rhodospirillales bacterium]|nr:hypothetical protein [Rhodospirillales bacterium]
MSLPATITITQGGVAPAVVIAEGALDAPPPGVPPYPLNVDPAVTWMLVWQNGVLTWVPWDAPGAAPELLLEGGAGAMLLEDGTGAMLLEA